VPPQASGQGEQAAIAASVLHFSGAPVGLGLPYGFRNNRFQDPAVTWESGAESIVCRWHAEPDGASLACGGRTLRIRGIERQGERCVFTADGERVEVLFWIDADRWHLHGAFGNCSLRKAPRFPPAASQAARPNAQAPMPGSIRRIFVTQGQTVAAGDALVVLEAMKMEHTIVAAQAGVVREVFVREGQTIGANAVLVEIDGTS
jgi:acetyl/propionyl-CoA carboxylase alpha subunit